MMLPQSLVDREGLGREDRVTVFGTEPGALLAALPIFLALTERGVAPRLATICDDPLLAALSRTLAARAISIDIERTSDLEGVRGAIAVGSGALMSQPAMIDALRRDRSAWIALVGLGSEACTGHDPEDARKKIMACLAEGSLTDTTLLHPFDLHVRTWLEIVEDVHHAVGPAAQLPIVDAIRAALFGRHGAVAVDVAARERPAIVSLDTASILWLRPSRMK